LPTARLTIVVLAACACLPANAMAAATAKMSAAFTPEHLGAPTAVSFAFQIGQGGKAPPPLTGVELAYPRNLGLATSGLGLVACTPVELEARGPAGCPADSQMGYGNAVVEILFGPELVEETVQLVLFAGPSPNGYLHLLVYARGRVPVQACGVHKPDRAVARGNLGLSRYGSSPARSSTDGICAGVGFGGFIHTYTSATRTPIEFMHPTGALIT
jgi:hypothetical protein